MCGWYLTFCNYFSSNQSKKNPIQMLHFHGTLHSLKEMIQQPIYNQVPLWDLWWGGGGQILKLEFCFWLNKKGFYSIRTIVVGSFYRHQESRQILKFDKYSPNPDPNLPTMLQDTFLLSVIKLRRQLILH